MTYGRHAFVLSALITISACESRTSSERRGGAQAPQGSSPVPEVSPSPTPAGAPTGDGEPRREGGNLGESEEPARLAISPYLEIREFGEGDDRAALFGLNTGVSASLSIDEIIGPQFLGAAHVGILQREGVEKLFARSAFPYPEASKAALLDVCEGETIAYFEGYEGSLCSGKEYSLSIAWSSNGQKGKVRYDFVARPGQEGASCRFYSLAAISSN